jgi:hypothetical protein
MLTCHAGLGLHHQARVHACGLDDRLSSFVSTPFVFEALKLKMYFLKIPGVQFLLARLLFLVYGRVRLG